MNLVILHESEHFLAVDKPAMSLSVPSRMGKDDPRPCVGIELSKRSGKQLWPVHRLDEEVSGILLFAKTAKAHRAASDWFEQKQIHKFYEAWTLGEAPEQKSFEWNSLLQRGKRRSFESPHGKPSTTRALYAGKKKYNGQSLQCWQLEPLTGRSHQLRVHLAAHGFVILGDVLYGPAGEFLKGPLSEAIALRAVRLDFTACADASLFLLPRLITAPSLEQWVQTVGGR